MILFVLAVMTYFINAGAWPKGVLSDLELNRKYAAYTRFYFHVRYIVLPLSGIFLILYGYCSEPDFDALWAK